ncbi:MAG: 4Fe-4S dicluster domain-containing protein [Planctomycetota bacterium]|jgi:ferredoxin-type protein NapH
MAWRRRDILTAAGGLTAGAVAGLGHRATARPPARLRPPGARPGRAFLAACIRCGQCVEACPDGTLQLRDLAEGLRAGAPSLAPREVPCTLCQGRERIECIAACPSGALQPVADAADVRIGLAAIDETRCLAFNGTVCRACWHACPFPDEAIRLDWRLRPVVVREACTGCGLCEHACPTGPSSVVVEPVRDGGGPS